MATYELPPQPDGPVWVSVDGEHVRADRDTIAPGKWFIEASGCLYDWPGLLALGPVTDEDPNPLSVPWYADGRVIRDADHGALFMVDTDNGTPEADRELATLVVEAVNAYTAGGAQ